MGFLQRFRGPRAPEWAPFFSGAEYERFRATVHAEFGTRGWTFIEDDDGLIVEPDDPEKRREFGLVNLAQQCHLVAAAEWPDLVREHFDGLVAVFDAEDDIPTTWDDARPLVKLRLLGPEAALPDDIVRFPVAPGLVAVLVLDLPTTVAQLRRESIADWPPVDELYRQALDNVRAEEPPAPDTFDAQGAAITAYAGDSFFVASRLLLLGELLGMEGGYGALAIVPVRNMLLVHPIRDETVLGAVNALAVLATNIHRDGPGSVSPGLFWWHAGAITAIEASYDGKAINVRPPDAFVEVLETLAASDGS